MSSEPSSRETHYSLFDQEEMVLAQAQKMVGQLHEVARGVEELANAYREQFRQQQRMVRISDRMQLELHQANQHLQEQAETLKALNESLTQEIDRRKKLEEELRELAITDSLTGLYTRRHLLELANREARRATRNGTPLSLVIIDLDHFKKINDQYGHGAGDQALKVFAQVCRENLRATDILGRIGGEEFAVLLPESSVEYAEQVAERVRQRLANQVVEDRGHTFSIRASFGVAACPPGESSLQLSLSRADKALYLAKGQGRNRTVVWREDSKPNQE